MKVLNELWGCHNVSVIEIESETMQSPVGIITYRGVWGRIPNCTKTTYVPIVPYQTLEEIHGADKVREAKKIGGSLKTHRDLLIAKVVRRKIRWTEDMIDAWLVKAKEREKTYEINIRKLMGAINKHPGVDRSEYLTERKLLTFNGKLEHLIIEVRVVDAGKIIQHGFLGVYDRSSLDKSVLKIVTE